jgi:hypothetical protein
MALQQHVRDALDSSLSHGILGSPFRLLIGLPSIICNERSGKKEEDWSMSSELKNLLTRMRDIHLKSADELKKMADAGDGDPCTTSDTAKRELESAERLQKTIDKMQ